MGQANKLTTLLLAEQLRQKGDEIVQGVKVARADYLKFILSF